MYFDPFQCSAFIKDILLMIEKFTSVKRIAIFMYKIRKGEERGKFIKTSSLMFQNTLYILYAYKHFTTNV